MDEELEIGPIITPEEASGLTSEQVEELIDSRLEAYTEQVVNSTIERTAQALKDKRLGKLQTAADRIEQAEQEGIALGDLTQPERIEEIVTERINEALATQVPERVNTELGLRERERQIRDWQEHKAHMIKWSRSQYGVELDPDEIAEIETGTFASMVEAKAALNSLVVSKAVGIQPDNVPVSAVMIEGADNPVQQTEESTQPESITAELDELAASGDYSQAELDVALTKAFKRLE